jgi:hypothetical protein
MLAKQFKNIGPRAQIRTILASTGEDQGVPLFRWLLLI